MPVLKTNHKLFFTKFYILW